MTALDLGDLGLDQGGHLLIKRALAQMPVGGRIEVRGKAPERGSLARVVPRARPRIRVY